MPSLRYNRGMAAHVHFSSFPEPPEPVRSLSVHLVRAALELSGPLPRWLEEQPLGTMSPSARQLAWAVGRAITRNPDHGFAIAERVPPHAVGSLWELYRVAPNVGALHAHYAEFALLLLDDARCTLEQSEASVRVTAVPGTIARVDRAEEDFRAAMQVATWRALLARPALEPLSVDFTYPRPRSTRTHRRLLGRATLRFSQPSFRIELARELWEAPLPTSDPALFAQRLAQARAAVDALGTQAPLPLRVDALVTQLLHRGSTASSVAERLGMSVRTLHRRLAEEGENFRTLLARARRREAALIDQTAELAAAPTISGSVRAALLGFANAGALRNARKRWRTSGRS